MAMPESWRSNLDAPRWTEAQDRLLSEQYATAETHELLRLLPGRSWGAIFKRAKVLKLPPRDADAGHRRMGKKVSVDEHAIVAGYRSGGHTWKELAAKHEVSEDVIRRVLRTHGALGLRPAHARPRYKHDRTFFDVIDSEAKAYWLGFVAADGCVTRRGKKGSGLTVTLGIKDIAHVRCFREAVGADNPITIQRHTLKGRVHQAACLNIWGDCLPDGLLRHGVTARKSLTHEWPELTGDLLRHYLRGYFDGDGHIGVYRQVWHLNVIGSMPFILRWREHMRGVGAANGGLSHPQGNIAVGVLYYGGNRQVRAIHHYLYRDVTIALSRKARPPSF